MLWKKAYSLATMGNPFPQKRSDFDIVPFTVGFGITTKLVVHISPIKETAEVPI